MFGETVFNESSGIPAGNHTASLNVSQFAAGMYLLRFSEGGSSITRRFIISK
jgi:hypothetical protein